MVIGSTVAGRIVRAVGLCIALGAVGILIVGISAAPAFCAPTPYSEGATEYPVSVTGWEVTSSVPVSLDSTSVAALAAAISAASAPATVSVPGTLTVNPWTTAGLPNGWQLVLVSLIVGALGVGFGRVVWRD